jgi:hypothetical protein
MQCKLIETKKEENGWSLANETRMKDKSAILIVPIEILKSNN